MKEEGCLVISLDFELLWGVFDKVDYNEKHTYFSNTKNLVPQLLELFSEYDIHVTWATVGMLFNKNWQEWNDNLPVVKPNYLDNKVSPYEYSKVISKEDAEEMCFAKDLISQIQHTPHQEIATHTYSHYYCLEEGQTLDSFKVDLKKAIEIAGKMGITLKSLVFPRNQFNDSYLKVCSELGIENVRSNPANWYWNDVQNDNLINKVFRTGDAYLGKKDKSYKFSSLIANSNEPLSQKASRLLRPYSSSKIINNLKLSRIKSEMTKAAKNSEIYHLWWHPHNFGINSQENIADLQILLEHYKSCKERYRFQSCNMMEVGNKFRASI